MYVAQQLPAKKQQVKTYKNMSKHVKTVVSYGMLIAYSMFENPGICLSYDALSPCGAGTMFGRTRLDPTGAKGYWFCHGLDNCALSSRGPDKSISDNGRDVWHERGVRIYNVWRVRMTTDDNC